MLLGLNHSTSNPGVQLQCNVIDPHGMVQVNADWSISTAKLVDKTYSKGNMVHIIIITTCKNLYTNLVQKA